jgi:hypothetical protein
MAAYTLVWTHTFERTARKFLRRHPELAAALRRQDRFVRPHQVGVFFVVPDFVLLEDDARVLFQLLHDGHHRPAVGAFPSMEHDELGHASILLWMSYRLMNMPHQHSPFSTPL